MDESYFKEKLSAYFDRSLPPDEMAMMDKYVSESAEARRILEEYRKLEELVDEFGELSGDDYWEKSAEKIDRAIEEADAARVTPISPGLWRGWLWKAVPVAASLILLTFIGLHKSDIFQEPASYWTEDETETQAPTPGPALPQADVGSDADQLEALTDEEPATVSEPEPVGDTEARRDVEEVSVPKEPAQGTEAPKLLPVTAEPEKPAELDQEVRIASPTPISREDLPEVVDEVGAVTPEPEVSKPVAEKKEAVTDYSEIQPAPEETEQDMGDNYLRARSEIAEDTAQRQRRSLGVTSLAEKTVGITAADVKLAEDEAATEESDRIEYTPDQLDSLLTHYRPRRERLEMQLTALKFPQDDMMNSFSATQRGGSKSKSQTDDTERELRRQLFEACFYIALSTMDDEEFVDVVTVLEDAVRDRDDPNRALAREYLDRLNEYLESQN